jgi:dTDP-4-amino-4,6-dideoxygalactose transaminase
VPISLVDLRAQYLTIQSEVEAAIQGVIRQADFILGAAVTEFEQAFARFVGTRHCIGVASGTDALFLCLRALGIGRGDKVLLPANTFIATALAVSYAGAVPVLADVDRVSYTLDVEGARRSLPAGLKAIIPVHLYGQPADMEGVLDLAREKGLLVIEDAAQAHGAVHRRGRCGTFGRGAGFSFYPGKNLGAYGDGGAVCTDDDRLAEQLRLLRNWGSTQKYYHRVQGFNSRLDTLQAAVLLVKLRYLAEGNRRRRQVAQWYREALGSLAAEVELPQEAPWCAEHVYHLFVVRLRRADRDAVLKRLHAEGIGAGVHYPVPIHLQEAYAGLGLGPGSFPVTEDAARRILSLPLYPELSREQVGAVAEALGRALAG